MEVQNEKKKSVALVGCVLNFTLQVSVLLEIMNGLNNFFPLALMCIMRFFWHRLPSN